MNKNKEHWYFLMQGEYESQGAFTSFYAYGNHLGEALANAIESAAKINLNNCNLIEANRLDLFEDFKLPENTEQLSDQVHYQTGLSLYDFEEQEDFISPVGVVKSTEDGKYDADLIKEQFAAYSKDENGIFSLVLTASKKKLKKVFLQSANLLPEINGLGIYLLNHWDEEEETEIWSRLSENTKEEILAFIAGDDLNLLQNGFIDIVLYCQEGRTNLVLDEHKQIQLSTSSEEIFNSFGQGIINMGFEQTNDFYTLEYGYYHWHYRSGGSLDKNQFRAFLQKNHFSLEEKIKKEEAPATE